MPYNHKSNAQKLQLLGVHFGLAVILLSIQPLANIVTSYTRQNRKQEGKYVFHMITSFLLERVDSYLSIID